VEKSRKKNKNLRKSATRKGGNVRWMSLQRKKSNRSANPGLGDIKTLVYYLQIKPEHRKKRRKKKVKGKLSLGGGRKRKRQLQLIIASCTRGKKLPGIRQPFSSSREGLPKLKKARRRWTHRGGENCIAGV